jgi:hypothetical protein
MDDIETGAVEGCLLFTYLSMVTPMSGWKLLFEEEKTFRNPSVICGLGAATLQYEAGV